MKISLVMQSTALVLTICALLFVNSLGFCLRNKQNSLPTRVRKARVDVDSTVPPRQLPDVSGLAKATSSLAIYASLPIIPVLAADQNLALSFGRPVLDSFVNVMSLLMIIRTVLSWYPNTDLRSFPYIIAVWPTEPLLSPIRAVIPPAFGVDVSSLVWVGILSFIREVFTGQQGILTLMEKYPSSF